jgi:HAMP domain-containing protein
MCACWLEIRDASAQVRYRWTRLGPWRLEHHVDIRTKFVLSLVAVSLGGMLALGWFTYGATRAELRRMSLRQLEAVAASKAQALENVMAGWRDRVGLISSRTQLRMSLARYAESGDSEARSRIARIVEDVVSVPSVRRVRILDLGGRIVVDSSPGGSEVRWVEPTRRSDSRGIVYRGLAAIPSGGLEAEFHAPLAVEDRVVGSIEVRLRADELLDVTGDYAGLDESGETLVGQIVGDSVVILSGLRHEVAPPLTVAIPLSRQRDPLAEAARGFEGSFDGTMIDYRGQSVRASARFLDGPGWGVVVKLDETEELAAVHRLRREMLRLALSLSAFAIFLGAILGLRFAKPIHDLAEVANRIGQGELDARADVRSEDEIGLLAATFNRMAAQLIETNRDLERQVEDTREFRVRSRDARAQGEEGGSDSDPKPDGPEPSL